MIGWRSARRKAESGRRMPACQPARHISHACSLAASIAVRSCLLTVLTLVVPQPPAAGQERPPLHEIEALITGLGVSGCAFERNGRWYDGINAQVHLRRKYAYLDKRGLAGSAEDFIERAASASSLSGKPYHVRCPGQGVVDSGTWFRLGLRELRSRRKVSPQR